MCFIYYMMVQSKVIRVLNLWQKNAVFPPEVIQPLFDMADSNHPKYKEVALAIHSKNATASSSSSGKAGSSSVDGHSAGVNGSAAGASVGVVSSGPTSSGGLGYEDASNDASQVRQGSNYHCGWKEMTN